MDELRAAVKEPIACYLLDGILIVYCIIATGLYFKEKLSQSPYVEPGPYDDQGDVYQELMGTVDSDPYQILEPSKKKKKGVKKQKPRAAPDQSRDYPLEFMPGAPGSPVPRH